jgi:hypothetical protein
VKYVFELDMAFTNYFLLGDHDSAAASAAICEGYIKSDSRI